MLAVDGLSCYSIQTHSLVLIEIFWFNKIGFRAFSDKIA